MSDYVNFKEKRSRGNFVGYVIASGLSFRTRTGNTRGQRNTWGQRIFDCVTAAGLFIFCLPILVLAALAIKIESPRSAVFFTQIRYGYAGKPFRMIKLRTMVPNAEQLKSGLVASSVDRGAGF
ncbi:sugar transferase, partial [Falsihalocynthiibacter sp. CO-5D18]